MNQDQQKNKGIGGFFRTLLQSLNIVKKPNVPLPDDIPAPQVVSNIPLHVVAEDEKSEGMNVAEPQIPSVIVELSADEHYQLGLNCFQHGLSDDEDIQAFKHFLKAAEQGHPQAQANLAYMYQMGYATPKDAEKAFQWGMAAAQKNVAEAQFSVALCYLNGSGVAGDMEQAIYWLMAAAKNNIVDAQRYLGDIYSGQYMFNKLCVHDDVQALLNLDLAEKYYLDAIRSNDLDAKLQLAKIYLSHKEYETKTTFAMEFLQDCAQADMDEALYLLGMQYLNPNSNGEADYDLASSMLYKAAQSSNVDAMYELGCLYARGQGVEENASLSKRYLELAAAGGHKKAKQMLYDDFDVFTDAKPKVQTERVSVAVKLF